MTKTVELWNPESTVDGKIVGQGGEIGVEGQQKLKSGN